MENSPHHISSNYKAIGPHAGANHYDNNTTWKIMENSHHYISSNYKAIGLHAEANHQNNNSTAPHGKV